MLCESQQTVLAQRFPQRKPPFSGKLGELVQVTRVSVLRVGRGSPLHTQVVQESGNVFVHLAAG